MLEEGDNEMDRLEHRTSYYYHYNIFVAWLLHGGSIPCDNGVLTIRTGTVEWIGQRRHALLEKHAISTGWKPVADLGF